MLQTQMNITFYKSVKDLIDRYDAFLLDLWGVVHDGMHVYKGAFECLNNMYFHNKQIVFISNAPRRSIKAKEGLKRVGIEDDVYHHIITSGELTRNFIKNENHGFGKNYVMIGPERDNGLLEGLDYNMVKHPKDANFITVTGFENDDSAIDEAMPTLITAKEHDLPMICANPDMIIVRQSGKQALCAGVIANEYQKMGGKVKQFGKPYNDVFQEAIEWLGFKDKSRIAMIGDNLHTDIKGANAVGLDSYLIAGGILGKKLGITHGQLPEKKTLSAICKQEGITPTGVLPALVW